MKEMKEIDFIKTVLIEWVKQFEGIHVKYAYEQKSEFHIIEVEPEALRLHNSNYKKAERSLWKSFMKLFPNSDVLISEPCSTNDMSNVLYDNKVNINTLQNQLTIIKNIYLDNNKTPIIWNSNNDEKWEKTIQSETFCENTFIIHNNSSYLSYSNHQVTLAA